MNCPSLPKHLTSPSIKTAGPCTFLYALNEDGNPWAWMLDGGAWQPIRPISPAEWALLSITAKRLEAVAA